jgi:2-oxoisovalerate dehydrogenase E1 component
MLYERLPGIDGREARFRSDEVSYVSLGDGSTSQGEFWESLNSACSGRLPVVYLIEDNGWAISVPVEVQTPGGSISELLRSFPHLLIEKADGTDFADSYRAMQGAVAYARERRGPALVHASVIRPYSHSLSDDERLYKTADEREADSRRDPLKRLAGQLVAIGAATEKTLDALRAEVEREINDAAARALAAPKPARETAALWVFSPDVDPASEAFNSAP